MQATTSTISINVDGTLFYTTRDTLNKCTFFEALLKTLPEGHVPFIDRDAQSFRHVLSLLRDPSYPFPVHLRHELEFFGIDSTAPTLLCDTKFHMLDDLCNQRYRQQSPHGPVQLTPIHEALRLVNIDERSLTVRLSHKVYDQLSQCGCELLRNEDDMQFYYRADMPVFVQVSETQFQCVTGTQYQKRLNGRPFVCSHNHIMVVPVLESVKRDTCLTMLVVTEFFFHQFQGLPLGCTLVVPVNKND